MRRRSVNDLTVAEARRRGCLRCRRRLGRRVPGYATWHVCADANRPRVLCGPCDLSLNRMVLRWAGDPRRAAKLRRYIETLVAAGAI